MNAMKSMTVVLGLTAVVLAADKPEAPNIAKPNTEVLPTPREKTDEPTKRKYLVYTRYSDLSRSGIGEANLEEQPYAYNGVKLSIDTWESKEDFSKTINLLWTLEYSGKRLPFIVTRPTLGYFEGNRQDTQVLLSTQGRSGEQYQFAMHNVPSLYSPLNGPVYLRSGFVSTKGKERTLTGEIQIQTDDIKRYLVAKNPAEFGKISNPVLYIRMIHTPSDRGIHYKLDAWTGQVTSDTKKLVTKNW